MQASCLLVDIEEAGVVGLHIFSRYEGQVGLVTCLEEGIWLSFCNEKNSGNGKCQLSLQLLTAYTFDVVVDDDPARNEALLLLECVECLVESRSVQRTEVFLSLEGVALREERCHFLVQ